MFDHFMPCHHSPLPWLRGMTPWRSLWTILWLLKLPLVLTRGFLDPLGLWQFGSRKMLITASPMWRYCRWIPFSVCFQHLPCGLFDRLIRLQTGQVQCILHVCLLIINLRIQIFKLQNLISRNSRAYSIRMNKVIICAQYSFASIFVRTCICRDIPETDDIWLQLVIVDHGVEIMLYVVVFKDVGFCQPVFLVV